jgi:hypothetical protein
MKRIQKPKIKFSVMLSLMTGMAALFFSCETTISPELEYAEPVWVVDAWLTSEPRKQVIILTQSQPYFDNSPPAGITGAVVSVKNETSGRIFSFAQKNANGHYEWTPANNHDSLGTVGDKFSLAITIGNEWYESVSQIGRVPMIDSITFRFEPARGFLPEFNVAEFWATEPPGKGDAYWIKAWKNGTLLLKPSEINLAFDAGFSERGNIDGVTFITPIRQGISPFDTDDSGNLISPYKPGDSVYVEIHSLTKAAFNFLTEVVVQTDRPGGFSELFASPIANVSTNVFNKNQQGKKVVGFFNVSSVSAGGKRFKN